MGRSSGRALGLAALAAAMIAACGDITLVPAADTAGAGGNTVASSSTCPAGAGCCTNAQCAVGEECVGAACDTGGQVQGVCKSMPKAADDCWSDLDCGHPGGGCDGARVCPCGAACSSEDKEGTCRLLENTGDGNAGGGNDGKGSSGDNNEVAH